MTITEALVKLRKQGAEGEIVAEFSGGGDEGYVDRIKCGHSEIEDTEVRETIEHFAEEKANEAGDWYNNEGGGGTMTIDLDSSTYRLAIYFNRIVADYEHHEGVIP